MDEDTKKKKEEFSKLIDDFLGVTRLPSQLLELQSRVFAVHTKIESEIENRIAFQVWRAAGYHSNQRKIQETLEPLFNIGFLQKYRIFKTYNDGEKNLYKLIKKLNKTRNEFAHKNPSELIKSYEDWEKRKELEILLDSIVLEMKGYIENIRDEMSASIQETEDDEDLPF